MPVISKISVQQKQKDRYNIFIDDGKGEKYAFSVDEDVLIKYQLKKGMELDDFFMTEIFFQDDIRKAYSQAIQYLAIRMRSELEVRRFLEKKGIDLSIINEVIHKLYHHKFINDQEFALAYVRTQVNTSDKGPIVIQQELKEKGIIDPISEIALGEYPYQVQLEKATQLAHKYSQKNTKDSTKAVKQKLEQMLFRKGYSFDMIQEAISSLDIENDSSDEMEALRKHGAKLKSKYQGYSSFEFSQKMKQALYRKGFPLDLIEQYLSEIEDHDDFAE
ncbi:recombination regulator RecX [Neobacillus sp. LXY-4]|uniref:recombination regulator RecX n=1 Tax=Neobacillus sp. LXY-4 TaxID=3379826 RepID=UPI003EE0B8AD